MSEPLEWKFQKNLKQLMIEHCYNQVRLSKKAGISKSTLCTWLAGAVPKDPVAVKKICRILGNVSMDECFFGDSLKQKTKPDFNLGSSKLPPLAIPLKEGRYEVTIRAVLSPAKKTSNALPTGSL